MTENEMVRQHHRLNGYECEQTAGDSEGQGNLACYSPGVQRVGHNLVIEQNRTEQWYLIVGVFCLLICLFLVETHGLWGLFPGQGLNLSPWQ